MTEEFEISLKNRRILVVEDNDQAARLVMLVLRDMGAKDVAFAKDGMEAWNLWDETKKENPFKLIISDWNMPNLTGVQLLQRLRKTGNDVPFIMITGRGTVDSAMQAAVSGTTAYIAKPFTPDQLSRKIISIMETASDQTINN